jgi:hypothetical protein
MIFAKIARKIEMQSPIAFAALRYLSFNFLSAMAVRLGR